MKQKIKQFLDARLRNFLPYRIAMGGAAYYRFLQKDLYAPEEFFHYGENVRIDPGTLVTAPERLFIGDNACISSDCRINAVGGCHLGRGSVLSEGVVILTTEHNYTGGETIPYDMVRHVKPVYIEDYAWIGLRACINPGVRIGEGAIVSMGSVVVRDIPPLAVAAGNPAEVIMYRSKEEFESLKEAGAELDPFKEIQLVKVPLGIKKKYRDELVEWGFDVSEGNQWFRYDKSMPREQRLSVAEPPSRA